MNKIIYLDSAASMQKPESVIQAQVDFLQNGYANSGRGICARAVAVDDMVANVRRDVAEFMGTHADNVVFTYGATDGLNRVVQIIGRGARRVAVSDLDHHSARVPWQMRPDTDIVVWPLDDDFNIDVNAAPMADVYVICAMSNVMGVAQDVGALVRAARKKNPDAIIVVDASQYVVHEKINADAWGADFICWSGHKIGADTGVGVMYIKNPDSFMVDKFGGGMVQRVVDEKIYFQDGVARFESGTLPLSQIVGLRHAIEYISHNRPDLELIKYAYDELSKMPGVKMLTPRESTLATFVVSGMHVLDFGAMVGVRDVCLRVGNMCVSWMMNALGVDGAIRISVGPANTMDEMQSAMKIIKTVVEKNANA